MSMSSRNSQQSSQEGSDPKLLSFYHSKPLLFGDFKEKGNVSELMDKFEVDRKKAKEKNDSDQFVKEWQHIRETLINIQQMITGTEKNTVFEKVEHFASVLKNSLEDLQLDISQKFETLIVKLSSQKELMIELEDRVQKNGDTTAELQSNVKSLKDNLEGLREEQEREQHLLKETLKLLNSLVAQPSAKPSLEGMTDTAIQTSPEQLVSNFLLKNGHENTQLTCESNDSAQHPAETSSQHGRHVLGRRRFSLKRQRRKKRSLVPTQRKQISVSDENNQPVQKCSKPHAILRPLQQCGDQNVMENEERLISESVMLCKKGSLSSVNAGCFFTPLSCWSQDSNSSESLVAVEPISERLSAEPDIPTTAKPDMWQLFDSDYDF